MMVMMMGVSGKKYCKNYFPKVPTCGRGRVPLYVCVCVPQSDCAEGNSQNKIKIFLKNISIRIRTISSFDGPCESGCSCVCEDDHVG